MLVVTGAAGFIGSCLVAALNERGFHDLVIVDEFSRSDKLLNLASKQIGGLVHRNQLMSWLESNHQRVDYIFHLGARTDTAETDETIFNHLNLNFSKTIWNLCCDKGIPLLYASSAATYGDGHWGYDDDHSLVFRLQPLNPYGVSKNDFDKWVVQQDSQPPSWIGLKFFNVYGPNEYHKGRMASVIFHAFHQIKQTQKMKLFRSHKEGIADGHQSRDFVYVKDIVEICIFCLQQKVKSGIYNAGTGQARPFLDLVNYTFQAMNKSANIEFIDTPEDIRDTYQYYTQAPMLKLREQGFTKSFTDLETGVMDYVRSYLTPNKYW